MDEIMLTIGREVDAALCKAGINNYGIETSYY